MINDYVVRWITANRDNVVQLMRSEINSFAIQNQASHLTSDPAGFGWGVLSFVTSFYGNGGTKFPDKIQAVGKLAGSYEYTNATGGNVLDGAISRAARAMPLQFGLFSSKPR
jgi:hypothetical protein